MKKLVVLFSMFAVILMTSCTKEVGDRLPGTWDLDYSYTFAGISESASGSITFNDDGTGTVTLDLEDSETEAFTWVSNSDGDLTIDGDETYSNEVNKKKEQVFTRSESEDGISIEVEMKLTK